MISKQLFYTSLLIIHPKQYSTNNPKNKPIPLQFYLYYQFIVKHVSKIKLANWLNHWYK